MNCNARDNSYVEYGAGEKDFTLSLTWEVSCNEGHDVHLKADARDENVRLGLSRYIHIRTYLAMRDIVLAAQCKI